IAKLDVESTSLKRIFFVHSLKNASAEELLPVLREVVTGVSQAGAQRQARRRTAVARARKGAGDKRPLQSGLQGAVTIVADKGTNTLVITATRQDYESLKPVIEKLDIQRRQVHIEAIIAEISVSKARELGFDYQVARQVDGGLLIGRAGTSGNLPRLVPAGQETPGSIASFFGLSGLAALAVSGETVTTSAGVRIPAHLLLFRALESDTDVEILSRPSILTRDNQEAEIVVGSNVPFIVSQQADRTDPNSVFSQIERRDIGVILRITHQITEGDFIKLSIFQEISSIQPSTQIDVNIQGVVLRKRSARTSILVKDGQLTAIGGLISDDVSETSTGIPILSRIPFLGQLFRFDRRSREKTNLLILLIPRVVRDKGDGLRARREDFQEILSPPLGPVESLQAVK
ncbi:MAG: secretin N-terminal domain-containing protein, partial [bacterium]